MARGTRPTQVRLTPSELERIERLKERFAIRTTSDVIRQAIAVMEASKPVLIRTSAQPKKNPDQGG